MTFPTGVRYYTGHAALVRRRLEETLMTTLISEGFEEVITPVFEYDNPADEAAPAYRLPDGTSGRMMALRRDFTTQIARLSATRPPSVDERVKWCYRGNVFRPIVEHAGQQRQLYQLGAELIGDPSLQATAGMLDLSVRLLRASGLKEFKVVVGHVGFVDGLTGLLRLPPERGDEFMAILGRKDISGLQDLGSALAWSPQTTAKIRKAMYLLGGVEVLRQAGELFGDDGMPGVMSQLAELAGLLGPAAEHLVFDLTEPRGFDYYTGVMFQAVVPHIGQEVVRGGRYDRLLGRYGGAAAAIGFALDLDLVITALENKP